MGRHSVDRAVQREALEATKRRAAHDGLGLVELAHAFADGLERRRLRVKPRPNSYSRASTVSSQSRDKLAAACPAKRPKATAVSSPLPDK